MHDTMTFGNDYHVPPNAQVEGNVRTNPNGDRYLVFRIQAEGGYVNFFFWDGETGAQTDVLDKIANEAERLTREFIGDVPPLEPLPAEFHDGPEVA